MAPVTRLKAKKDTQPRQKIAQPIKEEIKIEPENSKNWTESEVEKLLIGLLEHGHMNLDQIVDKHLPTKQVKNCQEIIRELKKIAKSQAPPEDEWMSSISGWIDTCQNEMTKSGIANGPLEIALVLKALACDGLVENHPLPEHADGVDFGACYRVLSQAVLGHPIQPVNSPTITLLLDILQSVLDTGHPKHNDAFNSAFKTVCAHFKHELAVQKADLPDPEPVEHLEVTKPVRCYERKKKEMPAPGDQVYYVDVVRPDSGDVMFTIKTSQKKLSFVPPENRPSAVDQNQLVNTPSYNPLKVPAEWIINSTMFRKIGFPIRQFPTRPDPTRPLTS